MDGGEVLEGLMISFSVKWRLGACAGEMVLDGVRMGSCVALQSWVRVQARNTVKEELKP